MSYLRTPADDDPRAASMFDADRESQGYVANYTRTFGARPAVYSGWRRLVTAIRSAMPGRTYELATVAAARHLRSSYCALAHGAILAADLGADGVRSVVRGELGELDQRDAAVVRLAEKVAATPADVEPADLQELRDLGFDDEDILDVILAVAARCFFSTVLEATGAEPDAHYAELPEDLHSVLTVGRPIESAPPR